MARLFSGAGAVGVSFFFILSGFVLTWVARRDDTTRRFWRRRLCKIFPNHLVTFLATCLLMVTAGVALSSGHSIATLLLVHAWAPDQSLLFNLWANSPTWSLSCEVLFYLAFPVLLTLLRKIRPQRLWLSFWIVFAAICAVPLVASILPGNGEIFPDTGQPWIGVWFVTFFPPVRMLEFVLGIVIALIVVQGRWIRVPLPVAVILPMVALVAKAWLPYDVGAVALTAVPLAFLVAAAATSDITGRGGPLRTRTMVLLGEISFALYLVHWLVVSYGWIGRSSPYWDPAADPAMSWPAMLLQSALTVVTSLVLAWLLYVLVERPAMRRWSRSRSTRHLSPVP